MTNSLCSCNEMTEYERYPHIAVVIPYEPKMMIKSELEKIMEKHANENEQNLLKKFSPDMVNPAIKRMKDLMKTIDIAPDKSVAIFVSNATEKVVFFHHSNFLENHPYPRP